MPGIAFQYSFTLGALEMKRLTALAATVCGMTILGAALPAPAQAAGCYYGVYMDGRGMIGIDASAHAATKDWACNRARRECNRKLDRARDRGNLPRHEPRQIRCQRYG